MNLFSFHKHNLDEVVFEHRNKEYGAYAMRKSYDSNLLKASASSFGFLIVFVGTVYVLSLFRKQVVAPIIEPTHITEINEAFRKIEYILDPPEQIAAATRNVNPLTFRIVRDPEVIIPNPNTPHDPALPSQPSGIDGGTLGGAAIGTPGGSVVTTLPATPAVPEPEFETFVHEMPSFVGGEEAMAKYLADHMNYPPLARENGIEGKVVVAFVVRTDGSIEVLNTFT